MNTPLPQHAEHSAQHSQSGAPSAHRLKIPVSFICLLLVVAVHAAGLGFMFYGSKARPEALELPTVQGMLISAPPAETVQVPSMQETPPPITPPPEPEPEPEPVKPEPKPAPAPKKAEPKPKPVVEAPPSEKAITQDEQPIEESPSTPQQEQLRESPKSEASQEVPREAPQIAAQTNEESAALGAPITPPLIDASALNNRQPAYPSQARNMRQQGTVTLELLIKTDGSVGDVRLKESSGFRLLDNSAMRAVKRWRYIPARQGTEAIEFWYLQEIEFVL